MTRLGVILGVIHGVILGMILGVILRVILGMVLGIISVKILIGRTRVSRVKLAGMGLCLIL